MDGMLMRTVSLGLSKVYASLSRRAMDVESVRIYTAAHVVFIALALLLLLDFCEGHTSLLPNYEFSIAGMEYISEKLMVCQHSTSWWQTLPHVIGAVLSIITLQHYAVFHELKHTAIDVYDAAFMLLSVVTVAAWSSIITFDHRKSRAFVANNDNLHIASVFVFLTGFCTLHGMISYQYYRSPTHTLRYSRMRRMSYFAVEGLHIALCVLFSIFAMASNVYHAILIEYVVGILFVCLNLASLAILLRVRDYTTSPASDEEWT